MDGVVCDTSGLLYLHQLNRLELLPALFEPVLVPNAVCIELARGRKQGVNAPDPRELGWCEIVDIVPAPGSQTRRIGPGEAAVVYLARQRSCYALLDDLPGRKLASHGSVKCIGLVGLLVRAKQQGLLAQVSTDLAMLVSLGFRISPQLIKEALVLAGEVTPH